jgi:chromosome segregation ATPase
MSYQSHLKSSLSNVNRKNSSTIGQIRERQIKEGSLWSKGYENIHSNMPVPMPLPSLPLPLKPSNALPDKDAMIIALQLEVDRLKAKVNNVIQTSEETITEFTLQHDDINNQYNSQYDELLKSYNDVVADRDKYKSIADNLTNDKQEERDSLESLKDDNNDNIQTSNYVKLEGESNSDKTHSIIENLQKVKETLEIENNEANEVIRVLNEKLIKLQDVTLGNNKFKQENDDLKEQLKGIIAIITITIIVNILSLLEISINYEESHNICMKLEQELLLLTSVENLHQDLRREHTEVSQALELEISNSKALLEKITALENSNNNYHNEVQKLIKLNEMNDNINNSTSKLNEKIISVVEQYESEKTKCISLQGELNKVNYDNEMLTTLLSAMEERNAKLDKQVEAVTAANANLLNENRLKNEEILAIRKQNEIIEGKFKTATNRVVALEASLVELSSEFRSLTEKDCEKFHSTLKEYESQLDAATEERESLIANLSQVTKERDEATALQSALSQLTEEMELKINQLENDKKVLSDANNNTCALNDELQKTTAEFLTVATSSIKELEEKLKVVEEERDQLLLQNRDVSSNTKDNSISYDEVHVTSREILQTDISIPFNATKVESSSGPIFIQCITAMDEYSTYSQEELRFLSYKK